MEYLTVCTLLFALISLSHQSVIKQSDDDTKYQQEWKNPGKIQRNPENFVEISEDIREIRVNFSSRTKNFGKGQSQNECETLNNIFTKVPPKEKEKLPTNEKAETTVEILGKMLTEFLEKMRSLTSKDEEDEKKKKEEREIKEEDDEFFIPGMKRNTKISEDEYIEYDLLSDSDLEIDSDHEEDPSTLSSHISEEAILPNITKPTHYKLSIIPDMDGSTFKGEVLISLQIFEPTRILLLHSRHLLINERKTILKNNEKSFEIIQHEFEEQAPALILRLKEELKPGSYQLYFRFQGELNEIPFGFFRTSFHDDNHEEKRLVATQFKPTYARSAFPCWDQPEFKATFEISIKHPKNYEAFSNMPVRRVAVTKDGKMWTKFRKTPRMSTHSVAFAVLDRVEKPSPVSENSTLDRVNVLNSAVSFMKEYTHSGYSLSELLEPVEERLVFDSPKFLIPEFKLIDIPGYPLESVGNWGLLTFRKSEISGDSKPSPSKSLKEAKAVFDAVAHLWFGNVVGPKSWSDLWITEGISKYLQYHFLSELLGPKMMDYSIAENNYRSFEFIDDGHMMGFGNDEREMDHHSPNVHREAAAMMHFLSNFMTKKVFQAGLRKILQRFAFDTITTEQFWMIMNDAMKGSEKYDSSTDMKNMTTIFLSESRYPVLNVIRNYETNTIDLTHDCVSRKIIIECQSKFLPPLNFQSKTGPRSYYEGLEEKIIMVQPDDWVILNSKITGYYRVIYDKENWRRLAEVLDSDEYLYIPVLNRAAILEDALWSFSMKLMDANLLIKLVSYLYREREYIPWVAGFKILRKLMDDPKTAVGIQDLYSKLIASVFHTTSTYSPMGPDDIFLMDLLEAEALKISQEFPPIVSTFKGDQIFLEKIE